MAYKLYDKWYSTMGYISNISLGPYINKNKQLILAICCHQMKQCIRIWIKPIYDRYTNSIQLNECIYFDLNGNEQHEQQITNCIFFYNKDIDDSSFIISSTSTDSISLWFMKIINNNNIKLIYQCCLYKPNAEVNTLCFNLNGLLLAIAIEKDILLFNIPMIKNIEKNRTASIKIKFEGHIGKVTKCKFHPTKTTQLISVSEDRTVKIWDTADHTLYIQSPVLSAFSILDFNIQPFTENICIGFSDGTIKIYDISQLNIKELVILNIDSFLQNIRQSKENRKIIKESLNNIPIVVSSQPIWSMTNEAKEFSILRNKIKRIKEKNIMDVHDLLIKDENQSYHSTELSTIIISIKYIYSNEKAISTPQNDDLNNFINGRFEPPPETDNDIISTSLLKPIDWILIGTSNCIIIINASTLEMKLLIDFQEFLLDKNKEDIIGTIKSIYFHHYDNNEILFVVLSAFQPCFTLFSFNSKDFIQLFNNVNIVSDNNKLNFDEYVNHSNYEVIINDTIYFSIFPSTEACDQSPLKLVHKLKSNCVKNNKKVKNDLDKAITFHSKIQSSGYAVNRSLNNLLNKKNVNNITKKKSNSNLDPLFHNKEYPKNCGLLTTYQSKNTVKLNLAPINELSYSKDGSLLAVASNDTTCNLLKLPFSKYKGDGYSLVMHKGNIKTIDFSHNNKMLLTSSMDSTSCLWAIPSSSHSPKNNKETKLLSEKSNNYNQVILSFKSLNNNKDFTNPLFYYLDTFIIGTIGNKISLNYYKIDTDYINKKKLNDIIKLENNSIQKQMGLYDFSDTKSLTSLICNNSILSPLLITSGSNRMIYLFDVSQEKIISTFPNGHLRSIHTLILPSITPYISHSNNMYDLLASSGLDNTIRLWDFRSPNKFVLRFGEHMNRVHKISTSFSPCMRYIATGSEDKVAYIYDIRTGKSLERLMGHTGVVSSIHYHPIHPQLVTGSFDGNLRFYTDGT